LNKKYNNNYEKLAIKSIGFVPKVLDNLNYELTEINVLRQELALADNDANHVDNFLRFKQIELDLCREDKKIFRIIRETHDTYFKLPSHNGTIRIFYIFNGNIYIPKCKKIENILIEEKGQTDKCFKDLPVYFNFTYNNKQILTPGYLTNSLIIRSSESKNKQKICSEKLVRILSDHRSIYYNQGQINLTFLNKVEMNYLNEHIEDLNFPHDSLLIHEMKPSKMETLDQMFELIAEKRDDIGIEKNKKTDYQGTGIKSFLDETKKKVNSSWQNFLFSLKLIFYISIIIIILVIIIVIIFLIIKTIKIIERKNKNKIIENIEMNEY
jgi:hypothetical protein